MEHSSNVNEQLEVISQVLIRCVVMGIAALLLWWGALAWMGDLAYRVHSSLLPVSREQFDAIHYGGMLMTKAGISLLFFFPYLGIRCVMRKRADQS